METGIDARATRLDDGIVAVALLGGFVFNVAWVVPTVAVIAALGALIGLQGAPLVRPYLTFLAPHLPPPTARVHPPEWRFAVALDTAVLVPATLLVFTDAAAIGWVLALAVAMIGALDATTGISISGWAYRRWSKDDASPGDDQVAL